MAVTKKDKKAPPPSSSSSKPAKSGNAAAKNKKKKWSKGKSKEKANNMVLFDKVSYDRLLSETPKSKLITPSVLSGSLGISASLARRAIREELVVGRVLVKAVETHARQQIYTRA